MPSLNGPVPRWQGGKMRKLLTNRNSFEGLKRAWSFEFDFFVTRKMFSSPTMSFEFVMTAEAWLTTYFQIKRETVLLMGICVFPFFAQWSFLELLIKLTPRSKQGRKLDCNYSCCRVVYLYQKHCNCFKLVSFPHCMSMCFSGWLMPFAEFTNVDVNIQNWTR